MYYFSIIIYKGNYICGFYGIRGLGPQKPLYY